MSGFSKLFSSIVTSSIWCEDDAVLRVWIAMLAVCNAKGEVEGSVPGFANLARVTVEDMRRAEGVLTSPDPDSRTPDHEGRRIERVPGGWKILNYAAYRERGQDKDGSRAGYFREYRAKKGCPQQSTVARNTEAEAEAEDKRERPSDVGPDSPLKGDPAPAVILTFPCVGQGGNYTVTSDQLDRWQKYYPGLDVRQQLHAMLAWLEANPERRKTSRGCPAFVVNWLNREQNKPKVGMPTRPTHRAQQAQQASQEKLRTYQMEEVSNAQA